MSTPKDYNLRFREILEADSSIVDLNKHGPNYYRFGQHLATMNLPESEDIANSMVDTFTQRFHKLINVSLSGSNVGGTNDGRNGGSNIASTKSSRIAKNGMIMSSKSSTTAGDDINTLSKLLSYISLLDNWERELFSVGQDTARQMKRWENRSLTKVTTNEMVTTLNKRKKLMELQQQQ